MCMLLVPWGSALMLYKTMVASPLQKLLVHTYNKYSDELYSTSIGIDTLSPRPIIAGQATTCTCTVSAHVFSPPSSFVNPHAT